ncbi:MAG: FAD-dependent oxidoreductase, partial [Bacteroidota bacterium]
ETGLLMLSQNSFSHPTNAYAQHSIEVLKKAGYATQMFDKSNIKQHFPAIGTQHYRFAHYNKKAGYAESAKVIEKLVAYARSLEIDIHEYQTASEFVINHNRIQAVKTKEGNTFHCGHAIVTAGAHTTKLLPELSSYIKVTGHPVFWLRPENPTIFSYPQLPVFMADISSSGWYGFPFISEYGVVKVAKHTDGLILDPDKDDRYVNEDEINEMRDFLSECLPELQSAPLVYTRRCLYTDTLDGHFWIDNHPEIQGLTVGTGGSGHAFKMGPILGEMLADTAEGKDHPFSSRYRWRHLTDQTIQLEESRYVLNRELK